MNIAVIGASAGVGFAVLKRALELNHRVTTLARRSIAHKPNPMWNEICGSALDQQTLARALEGAEAILVTLGTGMNTGATTLYSRFADRLLAIHAHTPIDAPVIVLTGFGSGSSRLYMPWFVRPLFGLILGKVYQDKARMEEQIAASTLRWEFVRPGVLTHGRLTQTYRVEPELRPNMKIRTISRADVADYMVHEAVAQLHLSNYPALTGK